MSPSTGPPQQPGLSWRISSSLIMGMTGLISKGFFYGLNRGEVVGLDAFLRILERRRDVDKRQRGLITVSNHISVVDDPLVWGVLPLSYAFDPRNLRFGLGAHDICYKNKLLANFFYAGQTLPTHRLRHSPAGGLFQPTMTEAIRLLSSPPYTNISRGRSSSSRSSPMPSEEPTPPDPFTGGEPAYYCTDGQHSWPAPSAFGAWNRHAWVHVFPEGQVHQRMHHPQRPSSADAVADANNLPPPSLRYFKWGVARLILESEPAPEVVPMFVEGTDTVMPEDRGFPRFVPRAGQRLRVAFGETVDFDAVFGGPRRRWEALVEKSRAALQQKKRQRGGGEEEQAAEAASLLPLGELPDDLKHGAEARQIRAEVAWLVRNEVLKLGRSLGYPAEDEPSLGYADAWRRHDDIAPPREKES